MDLRTIGPSDQYIDKLMDQQTNEPFDSGTWEYRHNQVVRKLTGYNVNC